MDGKFLYATLTFSTEHDADVTIWEDCGNDTWVGMAPDPEFIDNAPWILLDHEDDYLGIFQQLIAEDLGYV